MKDNIVESVRQDLLNRSELGIKKYNTTLDRTDLSLEDWLNHLYEELLDAALYSKRTILEINLYKEKIIQLNELIQSMEAELNQLKAMNHLHHKRRNWHY